MYKNGVPLFCVFHMYNPLYDKENKNQELKKIMFRKTWERLSLTHSVEIIGTRKILST